MKFNRKNTFTQIVIIFSAILFYTAIQNWDATVSKASAFLGIFTPLIVGLCIAFVLNLPLNLFENRIFGKFGKKNTRPSRFFRRIERPLCLILSTLLVLGILSLFFMIIIPEIRNSIITLGTNLPSYMANVTSTVNGLLEKFHISEDAFLSLSLDKIDWTKIGNKILEFIPTGSSAVISFTSGLVSGIFDFVLGFAFAMYVLAAKEKLGRQFHRIGNLLLEPKVGDRILSVISLANTSFTKFVIGQCAEALVLGTLCYIGMLIFKMPFALMVSAFITITALIPIFGAFIGVGFGAFMILLVDPVMAVWFTVYIIILQQIETNVIYPRVVGKSVGLPGLLVLMAVTVGGGLFGLVGMLVSVPLTSVAYTLFAEYLKKRELENNTRSPRVFDHDD